MTKLPVLVKGILRSDDALLAVKHGASGIIVFNHGARQLDTTPATISVLPEIADSVAGAAELCLDGGIRRGTDVLKAIACGARAVFIGRPSSTCITLDEVVEAPLRKEFRTQNGEYRTVPVSVTSTDRDFRILTSGF